MSYRKPIAVLILAVGFSSGVAAQELMERVAVSRNDAARGSKKGELRGAFTLSQSLP